MIKTIIVDDEKPVREAFVNMLRDYFPQIHILAVCENVNDAIVATKNLHPELVFLDVEMPPLTGFDFLEGVKEIPFEVIFTTSHNKYALQAIKFSALDYLLKPFGTEDVQLALERFEQKQYKEKTPAQFEMLLKHFKGIKEPLKTLALPTLSGLTIVKLSDIIRCESDNNYTTFFLINGGRIMVTRSLKEYEELLEDSEFFRIHSKHLINLAHLKGYTRGDGGIATMDDGSELDVARRRKDDFIQKISSK